MRIAIGNALKRSTQPFDLGPRLCQGVQQAVGIYNGFQADLNKAQLEVIKCQAAMQSVGGQISEAVKKELAEKATAAAAEATAPAANDAHSRDIPPRRSKSERCRIPTSKLHLQSCWSW